MNIIQAARNRLAIEHAAAKAWPDCELQWLHDEDGLSIDNSSYPWNPIEKTKDAIHLAERLNRFDFLELLPTTKEENIPLLRSNFVMLVAMSKTGYLST